MVWITGGCMGGTANGTVVLHVAPESAAGGPLGLVRTGDLISLDIGKRRVNVELTIGELDERRREPALPPLMRKPARGYARLYTDGVLEADKGCDFEFLRANALPPSPDRSMSS